MKAPRVLLAGLSMLLSVALHAQSTQYMAIFATNNGVLFHPTQTNDVITIVGGAGGADTLRIYGLCPIGTNQLQIGQTYTGLSGVGVQAFGDGVIIYTTIQITHQSATVVSNYVPADAVVIPTSATGPVQVILETSPDLVNWTAASPGTYSGANGTNRFFRVRAVVN